MIFCGELAVSFNEIQKLNNSYIQKIHSSQEIIIEKERLASLGQLIGGIAHNLKTPIMSISGATEGLVDLINEYNASIADPDVNSQDHHEIARDMKTWVDKIKTHIEYMSDAITAVKGQAVALSEEQYTDFSLEELVKYINILMKHELKNALVSLNVSMKVDCNLKIHGDINSMVQVINNMISNSIAAYEGRKDKSIELIFDKQQNNLIITIRDFGVGMTTEIKNKLFKEMITTKGKNGTGLGLFMSYATIRGRFNGDITFTSELGKGTCFTITIPL